MPSQAFIDTCKAAGWKVDFYVSYHMYSSYGLQNVQADFLWIPRYGAKPKYPCDLWQYADNATGGHVEGVGNSNFANVREIPSTDAAIKRQVYKNSGHIYLAWHYDGSYFWYKIAENSWLRADVRRKISRYRLGKRH